jgi:hypothetical protein
LAINALKKFFLASLDYAGAKKGMEGKMVG